MNLGVEQGLAGLRARIAAWKANGERVGLVPTMGNLHAGHLALVDQLKRSCDRIVTSIFVNPTQFGPNEDFDSYPRTLEADLELLEARGVDLAWTPTVEAMYPIAEPFLVRAPEGLANTLCGADRPGHFDGVASVVLRLFLQVGPDAAIFGEKDFQQLLLIRCLVADYALEIDIQGLPTVREADGLAMSSRNQYLAETERGRAPELNAVLVETAAGLRNGEDWRRLHTDALARLAAAGFESQYLEWRSAVDLGAPEAGAPQRLLAAARLGKARLIDNVPV
jgi:pantoate--beta-alanine ligase